MGQRAFRGRITDSLIKTYFTPEIKENNSENLIFYKLIDLEYTFDLDNPLKDINPDINLTRGLINLNIPKNTRVNKLKLIITSKLFGQGKSYLNCNLYILFGSHFKTDIGEINILLHNTASGGLYNDRKVIRNILDYMCFKTVKKVVVNNELIYYIIPEYSEFNIVLAFCRGSVENIFFHTYCTFEASVINFSRCLRAIEKTIPGDVLNIILPVVYFSKGEVDNYAMISEFSNFIKEIGVRFKIVSFEVKVKFIENHEEFITRLIEDNLNTLKSLEHAFIAFEFCNQDFLQIKTLKKILVKFKLENITLAFHNSFMKFNSQTNLDDQFDYYNYISYDIEFSKKVYKSLNQLKLFTRSKYTKHLILQKLHGEDYQIKLFKEGSIDYSQELIKNKKLIPLEISQCNLIYTN
jgi:hypothetical protein